MNKQNIEGLKETARYLLLFVISWIITSILSQIDVIPVTYTLKVLGLIFVIPLQVTVSFLLTGLGRYLDKYYYLKKDIKLTGF